MCMSYIVPLGNGLIKVSDGIVWVCACNHICLFLEDTLDALIGLRTGKMGGRKEEKKGRKKIRESRKQKGTKFRWLNDMHRYMQIHLEVLIPCSGTCSRLIAHPCSPS